MNAGTRGYTFGDWLVEPEENRVSRGDEAHQLEALTMDLLVYLLEHPEEVVSSETLLVELWPGRVVEQSSVHRRINQIRQILGDDAREPRYIRTIIKRGYRTLAPVQRNAPRSDAPARSKSPNRPAQLPRASVWMAVVAAGLLGLVLLWPGESDVSPSPEEVAPLPAESVNPVIVVLPFRTTDGVDEEASALAAGFTSEVAGLLGREKRLDLIAQFSAMRFRERTDDVRAAAELLGADYVLDGSVSVTGRQARIDAELVETEGGTRVWDDFFQLDIDELDSYFELYDEIAHATVLGLQVVIDAEQLDLPFTTPPTTSLEAYRHFREALTTMRRGQMRSAMAKVDRALASDPRFARAYTLRGLILMQIGEMGLMPAVDGYIEARDALNEALALDPELGLAHMHQAALAARLDLDFTKAWQLLDRADELGVPRSLIAVRRSELLLNTGRYPEALLYCRTAERLDPLWTELPAQTARVLDRMGRISEARAIFERLATDAPGFWGMNYFWAHLIRYDLERATELVDSLDPEMANRSMRPILAHALGDPEPLEAAVTRWVDNRSDFYMPADVIAFAYFRLGDYGRHLDWFEQQVKEYRSLAFLYDNFFGRDLTHIAPAGYWGTLETWAKGNPERETRVLEHRGSVERLMEKMVLPE